MIYQIDKCFYLEDKITLEKQFFICLLKKETLCKNIRELGL